MAREQRKDVDYFPHECTHGRKMHIIETKYGNDGYATWFKLLEQLGKANNHYIDISDEMNFLFLVSTFKIDEDKTKSILNDLAKLGAIDKYLFEQYNIIWSEKFKESITDAYRKRKLKIFQYSDILKEIGVFSAQTDGGLTEETELKEESIRKEEKRKEEESKEEKRRVDDFDNSKNLDHLKSLKFESQSWQETVAMQQKIEIDLIIKKLDEFELFLRSIEKSHESKKEFVTHFINWLPKNLKDKNNSNGKTLTRNR